MENASSLHRFLDAQAKDYEVALAEIKNGRKRSHWMWYIFPQIQGLGFSSTSQYYAIKDLAEAQAFLEHPILGPRLLRICEALVSLPAHNAYQVFGSPDDVKLKSSMTLFAALNVHLVFEKVLDCFYRGEKDEKTLQILIQKRTMSSNQ